MKTLHKFITLTMLFTLMTTSIQGQEGDVLECEEIDCPAYIQSSRAAHWSAYVPITIFIAAAIWLGVADRKNRHFHSSCINNEEPLGSLGTSRLSCHSPSNYCKYCQGSCSH